MKGRAWRLCSVCEFLRGWKWHYATRVVGLTEMTWTRAIFGVGDVVPWCCKQLMVRYGNHLPDSLVVGMVCRWVEG